MAKRRLRPQAEGFLLVVLAVAAGVLAAKTVQAVRNWQ